MKKILKRLATGFLAFASIVTEDNEQFSTSSDWASHKNNTNAGKTNEDSICFGTSEPDDKQRCFDLRCLYH